MKNQLKIYLITELILKEQKKKRIIKLQRDGIASKSIKQYVKKKKEN